MKKYIKYLSFCILAGIGLSSCDADDNGYKEDPVDLGGYAYLQNRTISVLDQNEQVSIEIFTDDNVQVESIAIEDGDGQQLTTASVSGDVATFNTSELGDFLFGNDDVTGSFPLTIVTTLSNGQVVRDPASISVVHAVSVDGVETIQFRDPRSSDETVLEYSVFTHGAPIDTFNLEWKEGEEGTFVNDTMELDPTGGEIDLANLDYDAYGLQPGDTLFYRFTATSGALSDQAVTSVAVVPQAFETSESGMISNDEGASQFSFADAETLPGNSEVGEVMFSGTADLPGFSAANGSDIQFVNVTDQDLSADDGVLAASEAFEAGIPSSSITNAASGDVYVYKVTREVENENGEIEVIEYYGIIEIGTVTVEDGEIVSFTFDYSEGVVAGSTAQ